MLCTGEVGTGAIVGVIGRPLGPALGVLPRPGLLLNRAAAVLHGTVRDSCQGRIESFGMCQAAAHGLDETGAVSLTPPWFDALVYKFDRVKY